MGDRNLYIRTGTESQDAGIYTPKSAPRRCPKCNGPLLAPVEMWIVIKHARVNPRTGEHGKRIVLTEKHLDENCAPMLCWCPGCGWVLE